MDIRKIKMKNPQQRGQVRGGADAPYIKPGGSGFHSGGGQHGSASGPNRGASSSGKSPLGSGSGMLIPHKPSRNTASESAPLMERYNKEYQTSRDRGECVPSNLYGKKKESPLVKAALSSDNSAPYGRTRGADSSRRRGVDGPIVPTPGAGRARGVNVWYPNMGVDASADSGESQRSDRCESVGTQNSDAGSTPGSNPAARDGRKGRSSSGS